MEQLIDKVAKAKGGAKVGAVAAAAVLLSALNYFAVGVPTLGASVSDLEDTIERAQRDQRKLDAEYIEKQAIANNLNQFRREKELLEQRLAEALAELPEDKKLDELIASFQDRASKAGLEISSIEPQAAVSEGFYARIPVPMVVQGNYHEIATFLDAVGRLRRIVNVSDLSFDTPRDQNGRVILASKFLATTFMFAADPKTSSPTKKQGGK